MEALIFRSNFRQGDSQRVLPRGPASRHDLPQPGPRGGLHREGPRRAAAAHGRELLPAVPGARAHLRSAEAHGSQRPHHPPPGPQRRRPSSPQGRRPMYRRQPPAERFRHQPRRSVTGNAYVRSDASCSQIDALGFDVLIYTHAYAGAKQRRVQERVAPCGGERRARAHVGGIFPVPRQQRGDQPRGGARPRWGRARVPELHLRRVLQEVLDQEPGPGALPGGFQKHHPAPVKAVCNYIARTFET